MIKWRGCVFVLCVAAACGAARAQAPEALDGRLPEDTLAFVEVDPTVGRPAAADTGGGLMGLGFDALRSLGVLPREVSVAGDAFGLAAMAGNRRFCIGLLDADLEAGPHDGLMCKSFQLVWLLDTQGRPAEMLRRLTSLLDHLSTRETSRQTVKKAADGQDYVEFQDTRWPAWLKLGWRQEKDVFVLAMGDGAMAHYLAKPAPGSEGRPSWAGAMGEIDGQARAAGSAGDVFARVYSSPAEFRKRFPEAMKRTLLGRVFSALELGDADKALFSARRQGRAVSLDFGVVRKGAATATPWTVPVRPGSPLMKLVPDEATSYLVLNIDWPAFYTRMTAVLDAILTDEGEATVDEKVRRFAALHHVDLQKDVLAKAQPLVLVHDWPEHPLGLPLMVTAIASANGGGPAAGKVARDDLQRMLLDAETVLDKRPDGIFKLRTDSQGVMYMQFGLVGPAWGWVGDRLVWSWSPTAVEQNLDAVGAAPAGTFSAGSGGATAKQP